MAGPTHGLLTITRPSLHLFTHHITSPTGMRTHHRTLPLPDFRQQLIISVPAVHPLPSLTCQALWPHG